MLPINKKISAYNHYNYNNPQYIVIHYVGAQSSTAYNNAVYFAGGDRSASAHYFVDDTSIWQSVEDNCGAWHVGNTQTEVNNQNSIGIEMCCLGENLAVTSTTEANAVELVKYLMLKYNISVANVRTHYEVSGKTKICPNWAANNWSRWTTFKNKLVQEEQKVTYKYEYCVCYCNDVDKRAAQYLADYYKCEVKDATIPSYWSGYAEKLIAVGGDASPVGFSGYTTHKIAGANRYKTCELIINICLGKVKLDSYKVK